MYRKNKTKQNEYQQFRCLFLTEENSLYNCADKLAKLCKSWHFTKYKLSKIIQRRKQHAR